MASLFQPFAGLSCLSASAILDAGQEMFNSFAGRHTKSQKNHCDETNAPPLISTTAIYQDHRTSHTGSSIRTTTSRRMSTFSHADIYNPTTSCVSVRSSLGYMKHNSPSIPFWITEKDNDALTKEERESGKAHHSSSYHPRHISMCLQDKEEDEHKVIKEDCGDEEGEYIFCDSTNRSGSSSSDVLMMYGVVNANASNGFLPAKKESFRISSLLGPSIVQFHVTDDETKETAFHTDKTLQNSALVGLYFAKADQCQLTTEYLRLFTLRCSHYILDCDDNAYGDNDAQVSIELQALPIVFCNANANGNGIVVPPIIPSEWYALPQNKRTTEIRRRIRYEFDIVATAGPVLVIFDPISGRIICSNAILDIIHLNHNDANEYDIEAFHLYESWLQKLDAATEFDDHCGRTIEF